MPNRWKGDAHDRYAALDKQGRRCDGNDRLCVRSAVQMIWVTRAGKAMDPFAVPEIKQTCAFHRRQFENSAFWTLIRTHRMPRTCRPEQLKRIPQWWRNPSIVGTADAAQPAGADRTADAA